MYIGHARLCVCLSALPAFPFPTLLHGPGCNLEEWYGVPSSYALFGGFAIGARVSLLWQQRRTRNVSECLYSLYAWFIEFLSRASIAELCQARYSVCLSVCLSHIDIASKRLKLSSSTHHRMITQEKAIRFSTRSHNRAKARVESRRRHHGGGGGLFGAQPTPVLPCKQPSGIAFHGNALCPHTDLVRISIRYRFVTDTGEYRVLNAWVIHLLIKARNTSEHTTRWQQ